MKRSEKQFTLYTLEASDGYRLTQKGVVKAEKRVFARKITSTRPIDADKYVEVAEGDVERINGEENDES